MIHSHIGPRWFGHGHDPDVFAAAHQREDIRAHLIDLHHWPKVARYDATTAQLDNLHRLMHEPDLAGEAVATLRAILRQEPV